MQPFDDGVRHFDTNVPVVLSEVIHQVFDVNYKAFKELLHLGAIYVNNHRQIKDKWILSPSLLRVHTKPRRFCCDYPWKSRVVFENDFFIILNKPAGIPSHPLVDNVVENALTQTSLALEVPLFVTHRLDTLTSGLIVYAKKKQFVKNFNIQMMERQVTKKYVALVESLVTFPRSLVHYMDPGPGTPKKLSVEAKDDWDLCHLEILDQKKISSEISWVKINLITGKTHQIRSQLSFLKSPIVGDRLYGSKIFFKTDSIALKSCQIEFVFEGKPMVFRLEEEFDFDSFKN